MITFTAFRTERMNSPFDLGKLVDNLVGEQLRDGDVLVISSKFMAISEGRIVPLDSVKPSQRAKDLSQKYDIPPELCELIVSESDEIIGGVSGFILTFRDGLLTPNAGIDKSNIEHGRVVLYPKSPLASAASIVNALRSNREVRVGVVVSDSRLMPTRMGTTGVALAVAGLEAVLDLRGRPDLFGNPLRVTRQAVADDLCSGAQLVMGEADESTPIVLVRGLESKLLGNYRYSSRDLSIPTNQCVYMRSLGYGGAHPES
jgi:coenzyme F420-0:L-glutamate ligase/coenzyme F420-1:gamma-L-glutamate ligase